MVTIDLITGFLGSGKTTFIRKYVKHLLDKGLRVCILENDFGAVNVDTMLIKDLMCDRLDIETVAGGCDYDCHRRRFKTKLIAMGMCGYDRVIVEPSGIYDVDEFFDTLYDEPLDSWYRIGSVITLVDTTASYPLSENTGLCFREELASAGVVIYSKTQCTKSNIDAAKEYVCSLIPASDKEYLDKPFENLSYDDFELIMKAGYRRSDYAKFDIENSGFSSCYFMNLDYSVSEWKELIKIIFSEESCGQVFRIKGFCREGEKWYEINATKDNINVEEIAEGQKVVIVIGEHINEQKIGSIINK